MALVFFYLFEIIGNTRNEFLAMFLLAFVINQ